MRDKSGPSETAEMRPVRETVRTKARRPPRIVLQRELSSARLRNTEIVQYSASDALALDLLPRAAQRKVVEEVRHAHMLALIMNGTVPLKDPAQIDGILDKMKGPEQMPLLRKIEGACRRRADNDSLATLARWRLSRQQP